jgi:exodeoxyribonuclease VII large subunit
MTTIENQETGHNIPTFSVAEISFALKKVVEGTFSHVRVRGEVTGYKKHASGHHYLTLKDDSATIAAVAWRGTRLGIAMEDGMEVICTGRLSTFPGQSKYQIIIESVELAGQGALLKLLEERRKKLTAEGLFDAARKKPLPFLPRLIGVITSPTGAVIRDIMHRLNDRFPTHVLLWPCNVQGDGAAAQVAAAIDGFNKLTDLRPDLIIVARGGGSLEDLMAFNEEIVVRAAAASVIPLISAVGHETDTTLIDYAADVRAPTPTAAAEMAVPVRTELLAAVYDYQQRLLQGLSRMIQTSRQHLEHLSRNLKSIRHYVEQWAQRFDHLSERFGNVLKSFSSAKAQGLQHLSLRFQPPRRIVDLAHRHIQTETRALRNAIKPVFDKQSQRLAQIARLLDSLSFHQVLNRGFALIQAKDGKSLSTTTAVTAAEDFSVRLQDGAIEASIKKPKAQGSLF